MFDVPHYVPSKKSDLITRMAYGIEKKRIKSAKYWTKEQFQIWCYKDSVGKKSFKDDKILAAAAIKLSKNWWFSNEI